MRGVAPVVVVLALGGAVACDGLFGISHVDPPGIGSDGGVADVADAPPDAHLVGSASGLMSFTLAPDPSGAPLAALDVRGASATIQGTPHTFVPYQLAATDGTFSPATGEIEIGDGGSISLASTYTASAAAAPAATATLTSGSKVAQLPTPTVGLVQLGPTAQNGNTSLGAGTIFGTQVARTSPTSFLKRIGVTVGTQTNAYLGVYADLSNAPGAQLVSVGPVALAVGLNELAITNAPLPPKFWVVAIVETAQPSLPVGLAVSTDRAFIMGSTYGPLPMSLGGITPSVFMCFLQYVQATP
jgi:hypothetical protein